MSCRGTARSSLGTDKPAKIGSLVQRLVQPAPANIEVGKVERMGPPEKIRGDVVKRSVSRARESALQDQRLSGVVPSAGIRDSRPKILLLSTIPGAMRQ